MLAYANMYCRCTLRYDSLCTCNIYIYIHDVVQIATYTLTKQHSVDCACNRLHVHSLPQRIIWSHCIMMSVISQVYSMSFLVDFVIMPCWQPLWYHHLESVCISMQTKLCWIVTSPGSPPKTDQTSNAIYTAILRTSSVSVTSGLQGTDFYFESGQI